MNTRGWSGWWSKEPLAWRFVAHPADTSTAPTLHLKVPSYLPHTIVPMNRHKKLMLCKILIDSVSHILVSMH